MKTCKTCLHQKPPKHWAIIYIQVSKSVVCERTFHHPSQPLSGFWKTVKQPRTADFLPLPFEMVQRDASKGSQKSRTSNSVQVLSRKHGTFLVVFLLRLPAAGRGPSDKLDGASWKGARLTELGVPKISTYHWAIWSYPQVLISTSW